MTIRLGAPPVVRGTSEWACFRVFECTAESAEVAVLGWKRAVGVRETIGEGALPVAGGCERAGKGGIQPGRVGVAGGRDRSFTDTTQTLVSRSNNGRE